MNKGRIIALGILLAVLLPERGHAQREDVRRKSFWGGVTLGAGLVQQDGKGADLSESTRESKPGFIAGGHLSYEMHPRIELRAEVLFAMKGAHHLGLGERLYTYTLNYLELPLLARVSLPSIKDRLFPFMTAGPMVAVLLSATGEDVRLGEPLDVDGAYKFIDFGVVFGAGAAVRISPHDMLGLEFRYDMGLRAVVNNRDTINNRGLLLVLQYQSCICSRSAAR